MVKNKSLFLLLCFACVGCADKTPEAEIRNVECGNTFCTSLELCCNGTCQVQDDRHCGSCLNDCTAHGNYCDDGVCKCQATQNICTGTCCSDGCVMTDNNPQHCGACGNAVPSLANASLHLSSAVCNMGEIVLTCQNGWANANKDASDGCEKSSKAKCGDGVVEEDEVCDGANLGGQTCASRVGEGSEGTLLCQSDCRGFDVTHCSPSLHCGNGQIDSGEACDDQLLKNQTCSSFIAGARGILRCAPNCMNYDFGLCSKEKFCGNGRIEEGESCDLDAFGTKTCESIVGTGSVGTLACTSSCEIDAAYCSAPSACGNGIINSGEKCDGKNLNGETCATVVGTGSTGTLSCLSNCVGFDTSRCTAAASCGNGLIEAGEACDGDRLNDKTCATEVGSGSIGTLSCLSNCQGFDKSGCSNSTTCGNGKIDGSEACDGTNVKGATCAELVGAGSVGTVLCGKNCAVLDISGCSAPSKCNNGHVDKDVGEVCDGNDLDGKTCATLVGEGSQGTLKCMASCYAFDTSGCSKPSTCGNGKIDEGEVCDGLALDGRTCAGEVGYGSTGTVVCKTNCMGFDTSKCTPEIKCGNGVIDTGEACDGDLILNATCDSVVGQGSTGKPACKSDCSAIVRGTCTDQPKCGNGKIDAGEACDKAGNLNGKTCEDVIGHGSVGLPVCKNDCSGFLAGTCSPEVKCGNGKLDTGEECDGSLLGSATCASVVGKGSTGTLSCDNNCKLVKTGCSAADGCNNKRLDNGEACDGNLFRGNVTLCKDYDSKLYSGGSLKCNSCVIDTSGCELACGNGRIDAGEECDKSDLNGMTCKSYFGSSASGTLSCNGNCKIVTTGCMYCGDGILNGDNEDCDKSDMLYETCAEINSVYYASGNLSCHANCTFDESACVAKPRCGDGKIDASNGEICDSSNIGSANCTTFLGVPAIAGLTPLCASDCKSLNYDNCFALNGCDAAATRCVEHNGHAVWQMCDDHLVWGGVNGIEDEDWNVACEPGELCNPSKGCYTPAELANPAWCYFQWLDSDTLQGYGRILLPAGYTHEDLFAQMLCTTDLSIPVNDWVEAADGDYNPLCDKCGSNIEFATTSYAAAPSGKSYCTFIFDFLEHGRYACPAGDENTAVPILLDDTTTLSEGQTRTIER